MSKEQKNKSLLSGSRLFRKSIKVNKDWLIPRNTACVILGISEYTFHSVYKKRKRFPSVYFIGGRTYYSMKEISAYADAIKEAESKKKSLKDCNL